jgi:hypothetical protein
VTAQTATADIVVFKNEEDDEESLQQQRHIVDP